MISKPEYDLCIIGGGAACLEPVQDLLHHRHLRLGGARNPHLLHVNSGFSAPSAHNCRRLVQHLFFIDNYGYYNILDSIIYKLTYASKENRCCTRNDLEQVLIH